ncbi:ABC transporter substrate-binding protein [Sphingomonas sp. EC-HK361]|nr:ABC transporter substrate-binding protein [Sphingomonas sp. EC-HK361]
MNAMPIAPARYAVVALALTLSLASCGRRADVGPVVVSGIGEAPTLGDSSVGARSPNDRLLVDSIAQGLVRFDAAGQIEPGVAQRWIVMDDGMSYIFRLRAARWQDGRPVTAEDVVAILKRQLARNSRNPLKPFLTAIDSIVEMTPEVIEIRLARPRPDLLNLFAQPEMALFRTRPPGGSGPFRLTRNDGRIRVLEPAADPDRDPDQADDGPERNVWLVAEKASRAILRFAARKSDLVSGGTFLDWPLLRIAEVAPVNIKVDPAAGLFGFRVTNRSGLFASKANRAAIAALIDRDTITANLAAEWGATMQVLPAQLDSAAPPAQPLWALTPVDQRRAAAIKTITDWQAQQSAPATIRIALPYGPGATAIWGQIAPMLIGLGLAPQRVGPAAPAELTLVDAVAPYDSARWYLVNACQPCAEDAAAKINAARLADTLAARAQAIAAADVALADDSAFIPIARPFRWSLVATRLRDWQTNQRAWHPLNRLRRDTN